MTLDTIWYRIRLVPANEGWSSFISASIRRWRDRGDGALACPVPPSVHGLKYSLFYGRPGVREVGYDNERGKGDHRHFQGAETAYAFASRAAGGRFLVRRADLARWQMSNVKVTVGGAMEQDASRRFVNAWHRAERGESVHERHLAFESWDALARVMTGKRMELLHYVRRHKVGSVRALAKALRRAQQRSCRRSGARGGRAPRHRRWRRAGRL
jgi:hypothetical protein